ncbi:medium-chain fatty acid ethyl ester synthase/esterase [Verticillium dahliae VdLs.17]|uniref:Medium-chain fatty acid ethyl ester synthase/esterase n=1 Tax=Verticillium dahliae (strain VdLs.17 / ATCC MYA-4575 / FGSC 10137) TaxID=498257 RepID=G2XE76_VERDV|nr:medium-chain fatty acid ethyl ester synthase/esterase [Verticillium dahliae VdLs.17]EGY18124.1 medium-chain fatty acid ethyl ester synthase/esterase [Verticillium dahliae VdLs.17]
MNHAISRLLSFFQPRDTGLTTSRTIWIAIGASLLPVVLAPYQPFASSPTLTVLAELHPFRLFRIMEWLGRAKIKYTHATAPLPLREKDGSQTDLLKVCESSVPPCQLNPLLFNGHMQTFYTSVKQAGPSVYYKRKVFEADQQTYHGTFAVDFAVDAFEETDDSLPERTVHFTDDEFASLGSNDTKPQLIVLHGLSGGSHEIYLRHAIAPLLEEGKWDVCVINSRGCAQSKFTSGVLYNARATWDIRQYCGEEGPNCQLRAAVVCSNPFNLELANKSLQRTLLGKEVYQRVMGTNMRNLIVGHKDSLSKFTDLNYERIEKATYIYEFDREVQCASWGYPTEDAYYRDASSCDAVVAIKIPFLAVHATDDPIAVDEAVPYQEFKTNPYTVLCTTSLGGHLSWFEMGGGRWHAKPVVNFLNRMAFDIDLESINHELASGSEAKQPRYLPMVRKMEICNFQKAW